MTVRLLSLGTATPPQTMTQSEALRALGYTSAKAARIFRETGIERRHAWVPVDQMLKMSWQEMTVAYRQGAVALSVEAMRDALDTWPITDIRGLTFCSVSGYTCPALSYEIAGRLGMREDLIHTNILGAGCQSAIPGLERAVDQVSRHGGKAAVINAEICSATYFPASEDDSENLVSNAIFSDAASCAIIGQSDDCRYPEIVDFESGFRYEYVDLLGYKWQDGRLKVVLSPEVPRVMPALVAQTVERLLLRNHVAREQVGAWILHPGGKRVLLGMEEALGLERHQTEPAWQVMRDHGNCSSATVAMIGKYFGPTKRAPAGGYGVACTMGAGGAVTAALLKWDQRMDDRGSD